MSVTIVSPAAADFLNGISLAQHNEVVVLNVMPENVDMANHKFFST
jgi:hypothetical protein